MAGEEQVNHESRQPGQDQSPGPHNRDDEGKLLTYLKTAIGATIAGFTVFALLLYLFSTDIPVDERAVYLHVERGNKTLLPEGGGFISTHKEWQDIYDEYGLKLPEPRDGSIVVYYPVPELEEDPSLFCRDEDAYDNDYEQASEDFSSRLRKKRNDWIEPRIFSARFTGNGIEVRLSRLGSFSDSFKKQFLLETIERAKSSEPVSFQRIAAARIRASSGPVTFKVPKLLGGDGEDIVSSSFSFALVPGNLGFYYTLILLGAPVLTALLFVVLWPHFA